MATTRLVWLDEDGNEPKELRVVEFTPERPRLLELKFPPETPVEPESK